MILTTRYYDVDHPEVRLTKGVVRIMIIMMLTTYMEGGQDEDYHDVDHFI